MEGTGQTSDGKLIIHGRATSALVAVAIVCTLVIAAQPAQTQNLSDSGIITFSGPPSWYIATKAPNFVTPAIMPSGTLYTIYSNLGPKNDAYDGSSGWYVKGSGTGTQQWVGIPFTPKSNAIVTEIDIALVYIDGPVDGGVLSLNETSNGLPGKALHAWNLNNLPIYPTCCTLDVGKDSKGLAVKKGTQYWVVARTNASETDTYDGWDFTYNQATGTLVVNQGSGWEKGNDKTLGAFGVFGKKTQ
jgi:hypothetical protein